MDQWRFVERVIVRNLHTSFIAEARNGARWAVGEITSTPTEAIDSAVNKLMVELAPLIEKLKKPEPPPPSDEWEDLL